MDEKTVPKEKKEPTGKEIFAGFFAGVGIAIGIVLVSALFLLIPYGIGWAVGWTMNLVIGPETIFGIQFEQLIALMFVFTSIITASLSTLSGKVTEKVGETMSQKFKEYRGY